MKMPKVTFNRLLKLGTYRMEEVVSGFEKFGALKKIFNEEPKKTIKGIRIRISKKQFYAYIDVKKEAIVIGQKYFRSASDLYLCLDLLHELVHIRQLREGQDLFDKKFSYVDRPTEMEAYRLAAGQARKFGLRGKKLLEYLEADWVPKEDSDRLMKKLGAK
ncbi:MAG: hypothetical protein KGH53_03745 [Candidatus Micrarchaeota archaeon]|nr:hypothetical protein [Candidatus Micrarchaeota archaeon]